MNAEHIESLLDQWGLGWQRGKLPQLWWIGAIGDEGEYQLRLHLDEHQVLLAYRFSDRPLRQDAETLLLLLEANERLTVFKLALDDDGRPLLLATWPAAYITADNLGFLITDMIGQIDRLQKDIVEWVEDPA